LSATRDSGAPAVSVIVPTFERREAVQRAVGSVLAQTFSDFELIVVDDGSTDGTGQMLEGVDDRLRYVWQENAGVAAARNRALELARAPLVAFLDSDNRWLPDHLAIVTQLLARHPGAVAASTCPLFRIGGEDGLDDARLVDLRDDLSTGARQPGYVSCVAARRATVAAVGGFDPAVPAGEDSDLLVRLGTQGPFVTIRRLTVVRGPVRGTLSTTAQRSGGYLRGPERAARNLLAVVERTPGPRQAEMARGAATLLHLSRSMQALADGDAAVLRTELGEAVRLTPVLSEEPERYADRLRRHLPAAHDRRALLEALTLAAEQWPDPGSDTARFLRTLAVATALRTGRLRTAANLFSGRARGGTARHLWRQRALLRQVLRRWRGYRQREVGP
jgi:hypothetical protein